MTKIKTEELNLQSIRLDYEPARDYFIAVAQEINEKTPGGIIKSPQQLKEEREKWDGGAFVIKVGPKCTFVKPGDKVFIAPGAEYHPLKFDGKEFMQVTEYGILGKISAELLKK